MENLYSVKEACGILKVKRVLVQRLIRERQLSAFKLGGGRLWRIREQDLKSFIAGGSDSPMDTSDSKAPTEEKSF